MTTSIDIAFSLSFLLHTTIHHKGVTGPQQTSKMEGFVTAKLSILDICWGSVYASTSNENIDSIVKKETDYISKNNVIMKLFLILYCLVSTKTLWILEKYWIFQVQVCSSMCDIWVDTKH